MPYYCTVPRCTSMAGKAKNVSFHQFPRDEELAKLWNRILKRGKPYTKYSKVCSLHFRPEDYTVTSVGKNKGQWRTLRKDAVPSLNLPSDTPAPHHRTRSPGVWAPGNMSPNMVDPMTQQQIAQAIYLQTMMAMQAATNGSHLLPTQNIEIPSTIPPQSSSLKLSEIEQLLNHKQSQKYADTKSLSETKELLGNNEEKLQEKTHENQNHSESTSYKCQQCSKCFKDPDVFILHKRTHTRSSESQESQNLSHEKENYHYNNKPGLSRQDTLKANPILANLLRSGVQNVPSNTIDANTILGLENQVMAALSANMESYIRNLSSMISGDNFSNGHNSVRNIESQNSDDEHESDEENSISRNSEQSYEDSRCNYENKHANECSENSNTENDMQFSNNIEEVNAHNESVQEGQNLEQNCQNLVQNSRHLEQEFQNTVHDKTSIHTEQESQNSLKDVQNNLESQNSDSNCDNQDLNEIKDSNSLVVNKDL